MVVDTHPAGTRHRRIRTAMGALTASFSAPRPSLQSRPSRSRSMCPLGVPSAVLLLQPSLSQPWARASRIDGTVLLQDARGHAGVSFIRPHGQQRAAAAHALA